MQSPTPLNEDYAPSQFDIICGRGDRCFQHPGNQAFRQLIQDNVQEYCRAPSKVAKSYILADIMDTLKSEIEGAGKVTRKFVRLNKPEGLWYDIGEHATKQKVGQTIREMATLRDPEKLAAKAIKRAKSYEARKVRCSKQHRLVLNFESNFRTLEVLSTKTTAIDLASKDALESDDEPSVPSGSIVAATSEGMHGAARLLEGLSQTIVSEDDSRSNSPAFLSQVSTSAETTEKIGGCKQVSEFSRREEIGDLLLEDYLKSDSLPNSWTQLASSSATEIQKQQERTALVTKGTQCETHLCLADLTLASLTPSSRSTSSCDWLLDEKTEDPLCEDDSDFSAIFDEYDDFMAACRPYTTSLV